MLYFTSNMNNLNILYILMIDHSEKVNAHTIKHPRKNTVLFFKTDFRFNSLFLAYQFT
jgi:hypothetical protein